MTTKKRVNKSKQDLVNEKVVKYQIGLANKIFPEISKLKTIYDGQTALNAALGFISFELKKKMEGIMMGDILVELKKSLKAEKSSEIKTSIESIIEVLKNEPVQDAAALLERFGKILGTYSMREHMKNPMSSIKAKDIIA